VLANYADRSPDEPMTATPSVGKTLRARLNGGKLTEFQAPAAGGNVAN